MTTVTKICLAMLLAAISATALFFFRLSFGSNTNLVGACALGLVVACAALYCCLNIATIRDRKIKVLLILFFISVLVLSTGFSELRKSNAKWPSRYISHE